MKTVSKSETQHNVPCCHWPSPSLVTWHLRLRWFSVIMLAPPLIINYNEWLLDVFLLVVNLLEDHPAGGAADLGLELHVLVVEDLHGRRSCDLMCLCGCAPADFTAVEMCLFQTLVARALVWTVCSSALCKNLWNPTSLTHLFTDS